MEGCDRRTWAVIFRKDSLAGKKDGVLFCR